MSTTEQDGYNSAGQKIFANFYDTVTGRLVEQIGYRTDGSITVDVKHAVDGSSTSSYYNPAGGLTEQDSYASSGLQTGSLQYSADGSHSSVKFTQGKVSEIDAFSAGNVLLYANTYNPLTGVLTTQTSYYTNGATNVSIVDNADGSHNSSYYTSAGRLTEYDTYDSSSLQTGSIQYAADGTQSSVKFTQGKVSEIDAYDANSVLLYANSYNPLNGALTKQTSYYANGATNVSIVDNADGSHNSSYYTSAGRLTEYDTYDSLSLQIGSVQYAADGTHSSVKFTQGKVSEIDAYDANNVLLYGNMFNPLTGALAKQTSYYANGATNVAIVDNADGSHNTSYYTSGGRLTEYDTYNTSNLQIGSLQYAADGAYVSVEFDALGRIAATDSYTSAGILQFKNIYNPATGALTEQDGYAPNGIETSSIVHNSDGSLLEKTFSNSGQLLTSETINAAGQPTAETSYAADGSYTVSQFGNGHLVTLTGYSATGAETYANHYDANTGAILEQDAYTSGVLSYSLVHAGDGTSVAEYFGSAGQLTERDSFNAANVETASTSYSADGSYIQRAYTGGKLSTQEGYNAQEHATFLSVYNADGSSTQTSYDASGNVYLQNSYNTNGQITTAISPASGTVSFRYGATLPNMTLSTSSLQASFDDEFSSLNAQATHGSYWLTTLANGARTYAVPGAADGEVEYYSDPSVGVNPFSISNGVLDISARRASPGSLPSGLSWTSGALTTYGSFSQTYGIFEMRAQLPAGSGFWPAFFLIPADGFGPPELDIMENLGGSSTTLYTSTHSNATGAKTGLTDVVNTTDLSTGFHTYAVDWEPTTITWFIDGVAVSSQATPADMHGPMYMILNLAIGGPGSWAGATSDSVASADELVDWVKVFQTAGTTQSGFNLQGSAANSNLVGGAGNDTFTVGTGNEHIDGAGGVNTVVVGVNFEAASTHRNVDGSWSVTSTLGVDTIVNATSIQFSDGVTSFSGLVATTTNGGGTVKIDIFDSNDTAYTEDIYNGSGRVLEHDAYAVNGQKTLAITHAADGSGTQQIFTNGVLTEQDGFNTSGGTVYSNFYNLSGVLTEQDGFDGNGHITGKSLYTNGALSEQDGYTNGVKTFANIYNPSGLLIEQDGFDATGHVTQKIYHSADGSSQQFNYDQTGAITQEIDNDTTGAKLLTKTANGVGGYTIVGAQNGVTLTGSTGADTFYGGGTSQTFAFAPSFGKDVVENFHAGVATGHDMIQIDHTLFSSFASLLANTHDLNGSAVITLDAADTITLAGVHTAALVALDIHIF